MKTAIRAGACALLLVLSAGASAADAPAPETAPAAAKEAPPNQWIKVDVDGNAILKRDLPEGGHWVHTDGFSDNTFRSKTGEVLIRTGIESKKIGYSPGFYTNTTVAWKVATGEFRVVETANYQGGSYGHGAPLPAFKDHNTPTPRHTYDGICYMPGQDAMYLMLGANWRIGGIGASDEAKSLLAEDNKCTWRYDFETKRWTRIKNNVWDLFKCSPYESHMAFWPEGNKLIFLNDGGNLYAEFDFKTETWAKVELAGKSPMSLYNARSAWDGKRALWVFRLGPKLCTFDPKTKAFETLPPCWDLPPPPDNKKDKNTKNDPKYSWKSVVYIPKHDVYLVCGPTGNDTAVYNPETKVWTPIQGGELALPNGYMQYDPESDTVAMNIHLNCFTFRYRPDTAKK